MLLAAFVFDGFVRIKFQWWLHHQFLWVSRGSILRPQNSSIVCVANYWIFVGRSADLCRPKCWKLPVLRELQSSLDFSGA